MRLQIFLLLPAASAAALPASATFFPRRSWPPPANNIFSSLPPRPPPANDVFSGPPRPPTFPSPKPAPRSHPATPVPHPAVANDPHFGAPSPVREAVLIKKLYAASDCLELCESSIEEQLQPVGPFDAAAVLAMGAVRVKAPAARKAAADLICDPKCGSLEASLPLSSVY